MIQYIDCVSQIFPLSLSLTHTHLLFVLGNQNFRIYKGDLGRSILRLFGRLKMSVSLWREREREREWCVREMSEVLITFYFLFLP